MRHAWTAVVASCAATAGIGWQLAMAGDQLAGSVVTVGAILALPVASKVIDAVEARVARSRSEG